MAQPPRRARRLAHRRPGRDHRRRRDVHVSGELHTFHIHQLDFLVTSFRGEQYDTTGLRDVIDVPFQRDGVPGEVTMIIPFTDPLIVGKFPYHCHIMEHEDNGMMANIEVRPAPP
ncbi:MAG TPA: multicopper oxidase domain-containing protein [Kofleriaceae bacterium]|nr:multicopper oxidase domain-containing protein [Kofleriaceae bacterium]